MTDEQLLEYRRVKLLGRDKQISELIAVNIKLREDLREGITLRDHFAGLALQGLLASPVMGDAALHDSADLWIQDMTESAYEFANAMMAEREKDSDN